ncbi:MAG: Holliday junction resolvase RuvX [Actinomycetota bacterium]|nr:Holliday junction resolvase RuvX [Actinomycetota bacterium]
MSVDSLVNSGIIGREPSGRCGVVGFSEDPSQRSRAIGLDLGSKRIGVAVSNPAGTMAFPHSVLERGRSVHDDYQALKQLVIDLNATAVIVGLPRSLNGDIGPAATAVIEEAIALSAAIGRDAILVDERMSTVVAHKAMRSTGRSQRQMRSRVDAAAATVILQSWLDGSVSSIAASDALAHAHHVATDAPDPG